jgi:hypothetical protein
MNIVARSARASTLLATALVLASAAVAGAQATQGAATDGRWAPWVGCWQPSARDVEALGVSPGTQTPLSIVCVVPVQGTASVDLVTVTGDKVAPPERVDATGSRRPVSREGCEGWETAEFSPDANRIYLRSEHQCSGNRTRTSTGIMSITPSGEWLDVQGVKVESNNAVRVAHYGRVPAPAALPADMKAALETGSMATKTAMLAAADSVEIADVIEATKRADELVVQAWLAERGQGFNMDAKRLAQVADAKVPERVIDLMVALSYPRAFAINLAQSDGQIVPTERTRASADEPLRDGPTVYAWDPMYSGSYGYGYGYRYSRYGLGYGYPGYYPGYYYPGYPIVITRPSGTVNEPAPDTRGRMVKGRGYTRPADRADRPSGSRTGDSSTGSSTTGSSSGGASSGSEPRTAKPRSP